MDEVTEQPKSYAWIFLLCGFFYGLVHAVVHADPSPENSAYMAGEMVGYVIASVGLWSILWWIAKKGYTYVAAFIGVILVISLLGTAATKPSSQTSRPIDKEAIVTGCSKTCSSNWSAQTSNSDSPVWKFSSEAITSMCDCGCGGAVAELNEDQMKEVASLKKGATISEPIQALVTKNLQACYVQTVKSIQTQPKPKRS
jgi:hypothetical protein